MIVFRYGPVPVSELIQKQGLLVVVGHSARLATCRISFLPNRTCKVSSCKVACRRIKDSGSPIFLVSNVRSVASITLLTQATSQHVIFGSVPLCLLKRENETCLRRNLGVSEYSLDSEIF
jgi:hypothetical protein